MVKMSTELVRHALNGPVMGTRWSAIFYAPAAQDVAPIRAALAACVDEVDGQMSTWKPDSDLMRLNRAPVGEWVAVPAALLTVLDKGLEVGRASDGAFDIGMGEAVGAWGFGPEAVDTAKMLSALGGQHVPTHDLLDLAPDTGSMRKRAPVSIDLSGIAKGYGVDRMAEVLAGFGITSSLSGLDGEMRAAGTHPDGSAWAIAIEAPDYETRAPLSVLALENAAVATSGDYRHWVEVGGQKLSHTMDPSRGGPVLGAPASVTVIAETCMAADAWATALMVHGSVAGKDLAHAQGLNALFIDRDGPDLRQTGIGALFGPALHD